MDADADAGPYGQKGGRKEGRDDSGGGASAVMPSYKSSVSRKGRPFYLMKKAEVVVGNYAKLPTIWDCA